MRKRTRRHLSSAGFVLALILLIAGIFLVDAIYRLVFPTETENIIGLDGFSDESSVSESPTESQEESDPETEAETEVSGTVLQLTATDMANGSLVLVDSTHPYTGSTNWTTFSAITDDYVKSRDTSLQFQSEMQNDLCSLFDAYANANGYANLQIYSTLSSTLDSSSIYTNTLPDRDSGYGFDIGLITSTGEVVPYLTKRNEWMVSNAWSYGFVLRYPSDKTETTGIAYAPHHFRYVGKVHAAIMHQNEFTLEEYLNYLQSYTLESGGLSYTDGTTSYLIYYVPADLSGTTTVQLPENTTYSVSGDNQGGFVITVTADSTATEVTY
jgi:D-alanyl-D-alanine carboxypeptidase